VRRLLILRLLGLPLFLWVVWSLTFAAAELAPGDPGALYDSPAVAPASRERLRHVHGLDASPSVRYARQLRAAAIGDFGLSIAQGRPALGVVAEAAGPTLLLTISALGIQLLLGTALGLVAAARHGRLSDSAIAVGLVAVAALPSFWVGIELILLFALTLPWLPPAQMRSLGAPGGWAGVFDLLRHMVLPVATLLCAGLAGPVRHARAGLLDALASPFMHAARSRGIPETRLLRRHALRQAAVPLAQIFGLSFPFLLSGAFVVEVVFSWPGLGRVAWEAVMARDFPVLQVVTLLSALLVFFGSLLADLLAMTADGRLRPPGATR